MRVLLIQDPSFHGHHNEAYPPVNEYWQESSNGSVVPSNQNWGDASYYGDYYENENDPEHVEGPNEQL